MMALPFPSHSLSFKNLGSSHLRSGIGEIIFEMGEPEPHVGLDVIPCNAETVQIQQPQIVPSLTCPAQIGDMRSGLSIPLGSADVILWYAFSIFVHLSPSVLRVGIALRRRFSQPFQRFLKVGLSEPSLPVCGTEPPLCASVSSLRLGKKGQPIPLGPFRALRRGRRSSL